MGRLGRSVPRSARARELHRRVSGAHSSVHLRVDVRFHPGRDGVTPGGAYGASDPGAGSPMNSLETHQMLRLTIAHNRRRVARRSIIVIAAVAFFLVNVAGGYLRDQEAAAPRGGATDQEIEAFLIDQVRDAGYPGAAFAIVRDGRISRSGGIGRADDTGRPVRADTPFVIGSLSKAITATAVMQLVERHLVELDAPVTRYIAEFTVAGGRAGEITVRQLLNQ